MPKKERVPYQPPPQDQLLGKLSWLQSRCKPDFTGHLGPRVSNKTRESVSKEKKLLERKWGGETEFRAYKHLKVPISMDATHPGVLQPRDQQSDPNDQYETAHFSMDRATDATHPNRNQYRQKLDPETGKPELLGALGWTGDEKPVNLPVKQGRKAFPEKVIKRDGILGATKPDVQDDDMEGGVRVRAMRQDIEDLTPRHRVALIRRITLTNPKFTAESRVAHTTAHWDPMSQLLAHAYVDEPRKGNRRAGTGRSRSNVPACARNIHNGGKKGNTSSSITAGASGHEENQEGLQGGSGVPPAARNNIRMVGLMRKQRAHSTRAWH